MNQPEAPVTRALAALESLRLAPSEDQRANLALKLAAGLLTDIHERLRGGKSTALVVALFGGTGVGKSTVLNTLAGEVISQVSVRRPATHHPVVYFHTEDNDAVADARFISGVPRAAAEAGGDETLLPDGEVTLRLIAHRKPQFRRILLVDTPDFDSVERRNKEVVQRLFRRADVVLFVTNPSRYADDEQWKFFRDASRYGKSCKFLFNRAENEEAPRDFLAKLRESGFTDTPHELPWQPESAKRGYLKGRSLSRDLTSFFDPLLDPVHREQLLQQSMWQTFRALQEEMELHLLPAVSRGRLRKDTLERALSLLFADISQSLAVDLEEVLGTEARERLDLLIRENLSRIADPFGGVRRAVTAPFRFVARWIVDKAAPGEGEPMNRGLRREISQHHQRNRDVLWHEVARFGDEYQQRVLELHGGEELAALHPLAPFLMSQEQVFTAYDEGKHKLKMWLAERFQELTGHLRGRRSWQLAAVQGLWMSTILAFEFGTGGGFIILEGIIDIVVFPILSPLLVRVLSWDEFKNMVREAGQQHQALCQEILARQRRLFADWLNDGFAGLDIAEELSSAYRSMIDNLLPRLTPGPNSWLKEPR